MLSQMTVKCCQDQHVQKVCSYGWCYPGHILHPQPIVSPGIVSAHVQTSAAQKIRTSYFQVERILTNIVM